VASGKEKQEEAKSEFQCHKTQKRQILFLGKESHHTVFGFTAQKKTRNQEKTFNRRQLLFAQQTKKQMQLPHLIFFSILFSKLLHENS